VPIKATIENPNGSHHIAAQGGYGGPLSKEELYPVIAFDGVPRVGTARVQYSVDRYLASSGWTNWRLVTRQILDGSNGIGEKTRELLYEAAEPLVAEWLEGDGYAASRQKAVAHTVSRVIAESRYSRDSAARFLADQRNELTAEAAAHFDEALAALEVYDLAMNAATS